MTAGVGAGGMIGDMASTSSPVEPAASVVDRTAEVFGPRSERERRRFEAYCRWSFYSMVAVAALIVAVGAFTGPLQLADAGRWGRPLAQVLGAVGATVTLVWFILAIVLTRGACLEQEPPRWAPAAFLVLAAVLTMGGACYVRTEDVHAMGAGGAAAYGPAQLTTTASVAILLWRRRTVILGLVVAMAALFVLYVLGPSRVSVPMAGALLVITFWFCLFVVPAAALTRWMIEVVRRLWRSREVVADLAVAEERLRFSRDLHDVFGRTLSTVAVKSELAAELARRGDQRAVGEMLAVRELAQSALSDVRGVVRGYRRIDLVDELKGARALLRTAGIRTSVDGMDDVGAATDGLSERAVDALAWAVREGVTNVLRHGRSSTATIALRSTSDTVDVAIENDLPRRSSDESRDGSGLTGLRERIEAVGGVLEVGPVDGGFRLLARVPRSGADRGLREGAGR